MSVSNQSQAEWSVAELDASINTLLSAGARRLAFESFRLFGKLEWKRKKKCCTHEGKC